MKEEFNKLRKKYKLPSYNELCQEFNIYLIESKSFILKEITKKIVEKIDFYTEFLGDLFHPDATLAEMYECNAFDSNEKKEVFRLLKKLYYYNRLAIENDLNYSEKNSADFINKFCKEWPSLKKELLKIVKKRKESWQHNLNNKIDSEYFG